MSERFTNIGNRISGAVGDGIQCVCENKIYKRRFDIARSFYWLVDILYQVLRVVAVMMTVDYNGS